MWTSKLSTLENISGQLIISTRTTTDEENAESFTKGLDNEMLDCRGTPASMHSGAHTNITIQVNTSVYKPDLLVQKLKQHKKRYLHNHYSVHQTILANSGKMEAKIIHDV